MAEPSAFRINRDVFDRQLAAHDGGRLDVDVDHSSHKLCNTTIGCITAWADFPQESSQEYRVLHIPERARSPRRPSWWRTIWMRPGTIAQRDGVVWKLHKSRPGVDYGWKFWSEVRDAEPAAQ
ncbi:hypothetical protein QEH34_gp33 [Microbacterium phage Footloose]|uniref:Uncharacterized protein n=1 Tax=Microbacterium phage Footloose TaxID=2836048 RepID=A0A8F3ECP6_9CAUD|nr:hypothetical protein QEH34_gp33 [Microbacterium phage Footloose]QWY84615.1 hypothetical protein SEA_FOOTLOOSE_33 [Microbacterium phage Footloose]